MKRDRFVIKPNVTLFNRLTHEIITGDLINEDEIEGHKFYVLKVGQRVLKLSKEAFTPKKAMLTSLKS